MISALLALSATPLVTAKESPEEEARNYSGMSYTLTSADAAKKYDAYLTDGWGFKTDTLPPEGVVAGATMTILKGDGQTVKRTQDQDDTTLTARFEPLQVSIKDFAGKPLKNVRVLFQSAKTIDPCPAVQMTASGPDLVYVMTDKHGVATLSLMWNHSSSKDSSDDKVKRRKSDRKMKRDKSDSEMKRNKSIAAYHSDGPFSILATFGETKVTFHLTVGGA